MRSFLLFIFAVILLGCSKDETFGDITINDLSASLEYKQLTGVDANLLSLDIYYNSLIELKRPVVIYVHGGAWSIGDKTSRLENKVQLFQSLDYVFVSVNYRLSPFPVELDNPDRVKYPVHNIDVVDAIKWVFENIDQYGGNPNKMALLGHSAGAHLVSLTGTNQAFLNDVGLNFTHIRGVASIDTRGYNVLAMVQNDDKFYVNAFGTDSILNVQASPVFNVSNGTNYPKFFIAKRGHTDRIFLANHFIDMLEQNGVQVSQVDGSIYSHSEINDTIGAPGETLVTDALKEFFKECFE